jgi:hypothetical protein
MDDSVKAFVERRNIAHYTDRLKIETDPVRCDALLKLLAEEEAKHIKPRFDPTGHRFPLSR